MAENGGLAPPQGRARANSQALASLVLKDYDVQRTIGEGGFAKVKLGVVCCRFRFEKPMSCLNAKFMKPSHCTEG